MNWLSKVSLAVGLLALSNLALAITPAELCRQIGSISPSSGNQCLSLVVKNDLSEEAAGVCSAIARISSSEAVRCVSLAINNSFSSAITPTCTKIAGYSASSAANCMSEAANKSFKANGAAVCTKIAAISGSGAVDCVRIIANKSFDNDFLRTCDDKAAYSASQAVSCLATIAKPISSWDDDFGSDDDFETHPADLIKVSLDKIENLELRIERAIKRIEKGDRAGALQALENAQRILENIKRRSL